MMGREPRTAFAALVEENDELELTELDRGNLRHHIQRIIYTPRTIVHRNYHEGRGMQGEQTQADKLGGDAKLHGGRFCIGCKVKEDREARKAG